MSNSTVTTKMQSSSARPVKVVLRSRDAQMSILSKKSLLKGNDKFGKVFLSPDRTVEERRERKQLVMLSYQYAIRRYIKYLLMMMICDLSETLCRRQTVSNTMSVGEEPTLRIKKGVLISDLAASKLKRAEPTETSKQPIRTRYLGHVTGYLPIRDQYFLIRSSNNSSSQI
eukprot:sb/3472160/